MTAGTAAGAPLEPVAGDVVQHRRTLGIADGVLFARAEAVNARSEVDARSPCGHVADGDLGSRKVGVLRQTVVLAVPGVLPVVEVRLDAIFDLSFEHQVLGIGVTGRRSGEVPVDEDSELHDRDPSHYANRTSER